MSKDDTGENNTENTHLTRKEYTKKQIMNKYILMMAAVTIKRRNTHKTSTKYTRTKFFILFVSHQFVKKKKKKKQNLHHKTN